MEKQFGPAILHGVLEVLQRYGVEPVQVIVDEKWELDCMLHAHLETVLMRNGDSSPLSWAASNVFIYQVDALMFNLENSVILREKDAVCGLVYHALAHPLYQER